MSPMNEFLRTHFHERRIRKKEWPAVREKFESRMAMLQKIFPRITPREIIERGYLERLPSTVTEYIEKIYAQRIRQMKKRHPELTTEQIVEFVAFAPESAEEATEHAKRHAILQEPAEMEEVVRELRRTNAGISNNTKRAKNSGGKKKNANH